MRWRRRSFWRRLPLPWNRLAALSAACRVDTRFLLQDLALSIDRPAVLVALCNCLATSFAVFTRPEIDALAADLRTGSAYLSQATFPHCDELKSRADLRLQDCPESKAVWSLLSLPESAELPSRSS